MTNFENNPKRGIFTYENSNGPISEACEVYGFCPNDNDDLLVKHGFTDVAPCYVIKINGKFTYALESEVRIDLKWDDLSEESKETLKGMVEYCIENELCMGMAAGKILGDLECEDKPELFRAQLESFCGHNIKG